MSRQPERKISSSKSFPHHWRIVWMSGWDQDYVDMEVPGHITFEADKDGRFQFGLVQGQMDCRWRGQSVDFSWHGFDENDEVSGRGDAEIKGDELHGHLYFHMGDDTAFRAVTQVGAPI